MCVCVCVCVCEQVQFLVFVVLASISVVDFWKSSTIHLMELTMVLSLALCLLHTRARAHTHSLAHSLTLCVQVLAQVWPLILCIRSIMKLNSSVPTPLRSLFSLPLSFIINKCLFPCHFSYLKLSVSFIPFNHQHVSFPCRFTYSG